MEGGMMKGAQKQMIVLRTGGSRYFDEAYFVLKSGKKPEKGEKRDLVWEANRILEENDTRKPAPRARGAWRWFLMGAVTGLALSGAILLTLWLTGRVFPLPWSV